MLSDPWLAHDYYVWSLGVLLMRLIRSGVCVTCDRGLVSLFVQYPNRETVAQFAKAVELLSFSVVKSCIWANVMRTCRVHAYNEVCSTFEIGKCRLLLCCLFAGSWSFLVVRLAQLANRWLHCHGTLMVKTWSQTKIMLTSSWSLDDWFRSVGSRRSSARCSLFRRSEEVSMLWISCARHDVLILRDATQ